MSEPLSYDRETIRFFDVAHEGAQLRAVGEHIGLLAHLRGMQPRSIVVIGTDQLALAAARTAVALRTPLPLPVVVTDQLPGYIGALDIVLVAGERASRDSDAQALITAASRGAETILAGPPRGMLLEDAPSHTTILPALPTASGPSPLRTIAAVCAVIDSLTADPEDLRHQLEVLAEEVDQELLALSPDRDETVNPARQLRAFARDARVRHSGFTPCGTAIAALVAELWSARGLASGYVSPEELAYDQDPYDPDTLELVPLKTVLWAQPESSAAPNSRAESVEEAGLGDTAQCVRLITRAFAATALDDPAL